MLSLVESSGAGGKRALGREEGILGKEQGPVQRGMTALNVSQLMFIYRFVLLMLW